MSASDGTAILDVHVVREGVLAVRYRVGEVEAWIPRVHVLSGPTRIGERGSIVIPRWLAEKLRLV